VIKWRQSQKLGEVTTEKEDVGVITTRIFESQGKSLSYIGKLTVEEIKKTENPDIIFRGNSLATKSVDYYFKMVALPYLKMTIGPIINEIEANATKKSCEIDPSKIDKGDHLDKNLKNLFEYCERIWEAIQTSIEHCPNAIKHLLYFLQQCVTKIYKGNPRVETARYTVVSAFLFLRFFWPSNPWSKTIWHNTHSPYTKS